MRPFLIGLSLLLASTGTTGAQSAPSAAPSTGGKEVAAPKPSAARLYNAEEVRKLLGLTDYGKPAGLEALKVAVLDRGFEGVGGGRAYLPADTVLVEHYAPDFVRRFNLGDPDFKKPFTPGNAHGRTMAQIVWAVTGSNPRGPRFLLLNADGPTMLRRAVRYAIEEKVDVILFSGNFEGAGNYDGGGPVNAIVDQALAAGIIWINSAGNYGGGVYNGPIKPGADGYLRLGRGADATALRFRNLFDENTVTVTLTWNDYRAAEDAGTDKDLDLYVEDDQGRVLGSSELKQVSGEKQAGAGESRNPRERVVLADLAAAPGRDYRIRVKARSQNFTAADRLRVLVTASRDAPFRDPKTGKSTRPVQFLDASEYSEMYPPADHPKVITVGDAGRTSAMGPTADGRIKPDVVLETSTALFSNGEETGGSSNAAAYIAGVVAILKADQPSLRTEHVLTMSRRGDKPYVAATTRPAPPQESSPSRRPQSAPAATNSILPSPIASTQTRVLRQAGPTQPIRVQQPVGVQATSTRESTPSDRTRTANTATGTSETIKRPPPFRPPWRTPPPWALAEIVRSVP